MWKLKSKKNKTEREKVFRKWFWGLLLIPVGVFIIVLFLTAAGAFGRLPSFEELENPKNNLATELYDEFGVLIGSFYLENRSYVDYDELSPALVAALVATEDARFYNHSGIDFISLARVGIKTIALGRKEQGGGSTITQQLAKNLFPREDFSGMSAPAKASKIVTIKLKEWITAVKLEYNYTKEEIITMYLNTVFYGSNSYGIKAAARTFYDKSPSELNVTESAMLVGVVNAPSRYNPVRNPNNAIQRRNTVLARMAYNKSISKPQLDSLSKVPLNLNYTPISHNEGTATYFREMIRTVMNMPKPKPPKTSGMRAYERRIAEWDYEQALKIWENNPIYGWCHKNTKPDGTPYNIYSDGLKIYTTLNHKMQKYAEEAVHIQMEKVVQPAIDQQYKGRYRDPGSLFIDTSPQMAERIIHNAMRYSERYRLLKEDGATDDEIEKDFRNPTRLKIFTYKGEVDTLMTPRDSILHHKRIMRASFMAVDPNSGHIKAYVGGPYFKYFKYDMVRQGKRQVGSTIKPFVYTFAMDYMNLTPCTMVPNLPVSIDTYTGEPWSPKESGEVIYDGDLHPLRWGLAKSRNNYSAWIMKEAKNPEAVAKFINEMGIHSYIDPVDALCLGPADVSLYEMVGAYATFANRGVFTEPIFITRIEDRHGNLIASFTPTSSDAINERTAYTMLQMLKSVASIGTATRLKRVYGLSGDIGGKTGTSQKSRDAWFMGVTPKLVGGVWVGGEDQCVYLRRGGEGSSFALPIFGEFIKRVQADPTLSVTASDTFYRPAGAVDYNCPETVGTDGSADVTDDEFFD